MKALLDTHTFLWAISGDARLSQRAKQIFVGPSDLWLSVASIWEILIKVQIGKMPLPVPAGPYIVKKLIENRIETLPISRDHVLRVESLPVHHSDPFDRMLIAQSLEEKLPLATADRVFERYPVDVIW
ncbi:MAG TPA: type II toxin-antitoxin system VapC family toxin [Verrucomicrobiae bacterium]|jgi:PIN domain nuclease of toxin-antitoxin system|nr:type II toxin-antitoxin system VapC family toxin [Verrucomicrobiae bacterium]